MSDESRYPPTVAMVPAKDPNELAQNLLVQVGLEEINRAYYVENLYRSQVELLRDELVNNRNPSRTVFIAGQTGVGKTTALRFLADANLKEKYDLHHINPSLKSELIFADDGNVNIVDVLMTLGAYFLNSAKDKGNEKLIFKHSKTFLETARSLQGDLEIHDLREGATENEIVDGILTFFTKFNFEKHYRRSVRERYRNYVQDLVKVVEEIIWDYQMKISGPQKPILAIIDDWEKLREIGSLNNVFSDGMPTLAKMGFIKIIPIPVHLQALQIKIPLYSNTISFILKLTPNKVDVKGSSMSEEEDKGIAHNKKSLAEVILRRIDPAFQNLLMEKGVVELAVEKSGGIVRQMLDLMYNGARFARVKHSPVVRMEHILEAIDFVRRNYTMGIVFDSQMVEILDEVLRTQQPPKGANPDILVKAFVNDFIICNMNVEPCFHVNPLLVQTVQRYAKPGA